MFATCSEVSAKDARDKMGVFGSEKNAIFQPGSSTHRESLGRVWGVAQPAEDACRCAEGMLGRWGQAGANHGRRNICAQSLRKVATVSGLEPSRVLTATYTGRNTASVMWVIPSVREDPERAACGVCAQRLV
jgi:hypothetical protein